MFINYYNKFLNFYKKYKFSILILYVLLMHFYFFYYTQLILVEQINNEKQLNDKFDEILTLLNNNVSLDKGQPELGEESEADDPVLKFGISLVVHGLICAGFFAFLESL